MKTLIIVVVAVIALPVASATGAIITQVDQQNLNSTGTQQLGVAAGREFGWAQAFTPTLNSIDAFEVRMYNTHASGGTTVRLDLFDGNGIFGTLLGQSASMLVTGNQIYHFDLLASVSVTPGNTYTFQATIEGPGAYRIYVDGNNSYSGGNAFNAGGNPLPFDIYFSEGLHASVVPEPTTLAIWSVLGGVGLVVGHRRRRRKAA